MSDHHPPKPINVEFFIPGIDPPPLPKAPPTPPPTPEERAVRIEIAKALPAAPSPEPTYTDDPESMIADLLGSLPRGIASPDPQEAAKEAKMARHNTHMTTQRLIEMEKRRQRRGGIK